MSSKNENENEWKDESFTVCETKSSHRKLFMSQSRFP